MRRFAAAHQAPDVATVRRRAVVADQRPRQRNVLCHRKAVVHRVRSVIHRRRRDRQRYRRRVDVTVRVDDLVGEAVRPGVARHRGVGEAALRADRHRAVRRFAAAHQAPDVPAVQRRAVVADQRPRQRNVLRHREAVVHRVRNVVHRIRFAGIKRSGPASTLKRIVNRRALAAIELVIQRIDRFHDTQQADKGRTTIRSRCRDPCRGLLQQGIKAVSLPDRLDNLLTGLIRGKQRGVAGGRRRIGKDFIVDCQCFVVPKDNDTVVIPGQVDLCTGKRHDDIPLENRVADLEFAHRSIIGFGEGLALNGRNAGYGMRSCHGSQPGRTDNDRTLPPRPCKGYCTEVQVFLNG